MGAVYKAIDTGLSRTVAIKFILTSGGKKHEKMLKRFLQEAEICANLNHPNIIKVYHASIFQNMPYLVMEYVEGQTLESYVEEKKCSYKEKVNILIKVSEALHHAHTKNIIHRDIKPSNVMVKNDGEPVLMDFGVAKIQNEDRSLTITGEMMGSANYMAPEQTENSKREIVPATDVYGLGGILYYLLTGKSPVENETLMEMVYQIIYVTPELPRNINSDVPEILEEIAMTAMEKSKEKRYQTAEIFAQNLKGYLDGKSAKRNYNTKRKIKKVGRYYQIHKKQIVGIFSILLILLAGLFTALFLFRGQIYAHYFYKKAVVSHKNKQNYEFLQYISKAIDYNPSPYYYFLKAKCFYD